MKTWYKFLILNIINTEKASIKSKKTDKVVLLKDFVPLTLIHRVNYLIQYKFYGFEDNPLKLFFNNNSYLMKLSKFIYFLSIFLILLILTILFNYFFLFKKNLSISKKDHHQL